MEMSWRAILNATPHEHNSHNPHKESIADSANIAHRGKKIKLPRIEDATSRLERIAKWKDHPVDDLLDWYKGDLSELDIRSDKDLQFIVCDYMDNITLYRGEDYLLLTGSPDQPQTVHCADCRHFIRDTIGWAGIGSCAQKVKQVKPHWPHAARKCEK
jgi:hypothetical protein